MGRKRRGNVRGGGWGNWFRRNVAALRKDNGSDKASGHGGIAMGDLERRGVGVARIKGAREVFRHGLSPPGVRGLRRKERSA